MIDKEKLTEVVENAIKDTDMFLVDLKVTPDNVITVEVDSMTSVDIDECVAINRAIEASFNRDDEDYELEVGSAGLTSPFKVNAQYEKNVGNEVETLLVAGKKLTGILKSVGDDGFVLGVQKKVKPEGSKRPVIVEEDVEIKFNEVKYTKYIIQFK